MNKLYIALTFIALVLFGLSVPALADDGDKECGQHYSLAGGSWKSGEYPAFPDPGGKFKWVANTTHEPHSENSATWVDEIRHYTGEPGKTNWFAFEAVECDDDPDETEAKDVVGSIAGTRATCEVAQTSTITFEGATFDETGESSMTITGPYDGGEFAVTADEGYEFENGETTSVARFGVLTGPLSGEECEKDEEEPPTNTDEPKEPQIPDEPVKDVKTKVTPDKTVKITTYESGRVYREVTKYDYEDLNQEGM